MAVATVTYRPSIAASVFVEGKYVCDSSPSATPINCGFVPSRVEVENATDKDAGAYWISDMTDDTAVDEDGTTIASGGITPLPQTGGTNHGFQIGTDANIQEASKTFTWRAYR